MTDDLKNRLDTPVDKSTERLPKIAKTDDSDGEEAEEQERNEAVFSEQSTSPNPIQRYLVAFEYIGTNFSGSEFRFGCRTVVGTLQEAFVQFVKRPVQIVCATRTDVGVHGLKNVCHVDVEHISKRKSRVEPYQPSMLKKGINHILQENSGDVRVTDVRFVPGDFNFKQKTQERTFIYRLLSGSDTLSVFEKDRAWHVSEELDLSAMQAKSGIRTLDEVKVADVGYPSFGDGDCFALRRQRCYVITVRARSFLSHQVRMIVGVLKCVGTGELAVSDVEKILNAKSPTAVKTMAPSCGLYLAHVKCDLP